LYLSQPIRLQKFAVLFFNVPQCSGASSSNSAVAATTPLMSLSPLLHRISDRLKLFSDPVHAPLVAVVTPQGRPSANVRFIETDFAFDTSAVIAVAKSGAA
jgi:hypothetical protein